MKLSFKRITSSGNFIPEIDGLRFIAITSVVLFHLYVFIVAKDLNKYTDNVDYSYLNKLLSHGHLGVPLFFIISGFVLGIPFAKFHLANGIAVNLKKFYLRRLTRLEPPYILVMTVLLFGIVYVAKIIPPIDGIKSYLASIVYLHNFIFPGILPKLNVVTWSLEVEVQFYILAPLMAYIYIYKPTVKRRLVLVFAAVFFIFINQFHFISLNFTSLVNYFQYFITGFLLSDLYVSNSKLLPDTKFDYIIGLILFSIIWLFDDNSFKTDTQRFLWELIQLTCMFFLYYYVLFHKIFKFLSFKLITNIGGMCYSIYLLHNRLIALFGNILLKYQFSDNHFINTSVYSIIIIFLIMCVSSIFFLFVERPCMDKDWIKKIFMKRNN